MNCEELTAEQILIISCPGHLFNPANLKDQLKKLSGIWHPDRNHHLRAHDVMSHINALYQRAENGDWGNIFLFQSVPDSKEFSFKYRKKLAVDIGEMYIGNKMVMFNVAQENVDLLKNAFEMIRSIRYPTRMLEDGFSRFVPRDVKMYETSTGAVLSMYKGPDQICLQDIVDSGFVFQPGHLNWVMTGLYNFILFMHQSQNKMFGGLGADSIFLNTKMRGVHILGGWWFTTCLNKPMTALPEWLIGVLPKNLVSKKIACSDVDLIALKSLAIALLGDKSMIGSRLAVSHPRFKTLVKFLRSVPLQTAVKEYQSWMAVESELSKLDIELTFNDVYTN